MKYSTVYDVSQTSMPGQYWLLVTLALVLLVSVDLGLALVGRRRTLRELGVIAVCNVLFVGFLFGTAGTIYLNHSDLAHGLLVGRHSVIEGVVYGLEYPTIQKVPYERFRVGDQTFQYTDNANGTLAKLLGVDLVGDTNSFHKTNPDHLRSISKLEVSERNQAGR